MATPTSGNRASRAGGTIEVSSQLAYIHMCNGVNTWNKMIDPQKRKMLLNSFYWNFQIEFLLINHDNTMIKRQTVYIYINCRVNSHSTIWGTWLVVAKSQPFCVCHGLPEAVPGYHNTMNQNYLTTRQKKNECLKLVDTFTEQPSTSPARVICPPEGRSQ